MYSLFANDYRCIMPDFSRLFLQFIWSPDCEYKRDLEKSLCFNCSLNIAACFLLSNMMLSVYLCRDREIAGINAYIKLQGSPFFILKYPH